MSDSFRVLWVDNKLPAKERGVSDNYFLVSNPGVVVSVKLDPKVGVVCLNKFDRDVFFLRGVKIVSGVRMF